MYSRVAEPYHSIFINNRLNTNSLVEPLTRPIELQAQPPFLLYKNMRSAISGFWFYCKEDCVRIHALLEKIIKKPGSLGKMDMPSQPPQQQHTGFQNIMNGGAHTSNGNKQDIFSMLSKAQAEFKTTGVNPAGMSLDEKLAEMGIKTRPNQVIPSQQQHHQPLMKQMSSAMPDNITSPNVVSFFAAAQQPSGMAVIEGQQFMGKPNCMPIVQQPPMTLDEIEKQHRLTSKSPKIGKLII